MLLPEPAIYVLIGIAAAVVLGTVVLFKRTPTRGKLHWVAVGISVVVAGGVAVTLMAASHVVRISAGLTVTEARVIGTASLQLDDHEVEITGHGSGITVILNESDRTLEVHTLVYGELPPKTLVPPDVTVAPHGSYTLHANLDYVGPNQGPPSSVSTKGGGKVNYWLTW